MALKQLITLKKTSRPWHLPLVAGLCVGIPLLIGWYIDDMQAGKLASIGALVILYVQSHDIGKRMVILMVMGFGFI